MIKQLNIVVNGLSNFTESTYTYSGKYGVKFTPNNANADVDIALQPKGGGAIVMQQPDGAATGGNNRGVGAVDFQTVRTTGYWVAKGDYSGLFACSRSVSAGNNSAVVASSDCQANGNISALFGSYYSTASQPCSAVVGGYRCDSGATYSVILGGERNTTYIQSQVSFGDQIDVFWKSRQASFLSFGAETTNGTATEMRIAQTYRLVLKNNQAWAFKITILAHSSTNIGYTARFERMGTIFRIGSAATTALEGSVQTIGSDIINTNLSGLAVAITADTTNGSLKISVTGLAATTIIWQARVELTEIEI